ncbi:fused response regulator/phosphatase [Paremcibacter congregatus]|uniref:PP2C family protein-serine/threonine phosphatase n=1 Tax=Paremcibacter congregatus TaxID=2043170 RepID=UPI0030EF3729
MCPTSMYSAKNNLKKQGDAITDMAEDIFGCRILIVDDEDFNRELLAAILEREGYTKLYFAEDGQDALTKAKEIEPDLIVMDVVMPGMDGIAACRELRTEEPFKNTPIIIHTFQTDPEERARIYQAGATDIFPKPVARGEVVNRIKMHLTYTRMMLGLQDYHQRLTRDLEIARSMQGALLPDAEDLVSLEDSHQISILSQYEASDELGGDFWGLERLDDDRIFVYVTDFAGHGISAALNTFRLHSLISNYRNRPGFKIVSPAYYLERLNKDLFQLLPMEQYATMLCGIIDTRNNTFSYSSAASTAPLILKTGTRQIRELDPTGYPLGMIQEAAYDVRVEPFEKGDMLFLYSDVLVESEDQMGRMIGNEQFLEMCRDSSVNVVEGKHFLQRFQKLFDMYVVRPLKDDLTAVTLERL